MTENKPLIHVKVKAKTVAVLFTPAEISSLMHALAHCPEEERDPRMDWLGHRLMDVHHSIVVNGAMTYRGLKGPVAWVVEYDPILAKEQT